MENKYPLRMKTPIIDPTTKHIISRVIKPENPS